jgi:hypothetical protein
MQLLKDLAKLEYDDLKLLQQTILLEDSEL